MSAALTPDGYRWWVNPDSKVWSLVRARAAQLNSDGCTWATEFYKDACLYHDILCSTHADLDGTPILWEEAHLRFRQVIQSRSLFGRFSPMAWWRYWAVRRFARKW